MSDVRCINSKIRNGIWHGVIDCGEDRPDLEARHLDQPVPGVSLERDGETWQMQVPIPAELICDGVHNFAIFNKSNGAVLSDFTVIAGEPLASDLRAEVELLRAELDMLKRAFRRHCVDTA